MKRVPQPPVQPALRASEEHSFWPGFILAVVGLVLLLSGARHATGVDTINGTPAQETELIKAFSKGGLQYASRIAPPPPPKITDQANVQEALQQWQSERANTPPPTWKVRVDTGATTPCPT
jgi:hypothetical protein